jgi:hypothetical protein
MLPPENLQIFSLGRIVPPPPAGTATTPTQTRTQLFIAGAGQAGLDLNAVRTATQNPAQRTLTANTGSPNPTATVGAAGTPGLPGAPVSNNLVPLAVANQVTNQPGTTAPVQGPARKPRWVKPALYIAAGVALGAILFR